VKPPGWQLNILVLHELRPPVTMQNPARSALARREVP
jgi:hypothetical protein